MARVYFEENQRFNQPWIWILMIGITVLTLGGLIYASIINLTGNENVNTETDVQALIYALVFTFIINVAIYWLLLSIRLYTRVENDGIHYRFPPIINKWKQISKKELKSHKVRKYSPLKEYGGWGYRISKHGKALNVRGNMGLDMELNDGKKLLLGTQKPEELKLALQKLYEDKTEY
ncbi:DUF6141 family protein [Peijinzhouia sedimentorum]